MEWKPIESCPKDKVVLVIGGYADPEIGNRYILDTPLTVYWKHAAWWAVHTSAYSIIAVNPTHWCEIELPKEE